MGGVYYISKTTKDKISNINKIERELKTSSLLLIFKPNKQTKILKLCNTD